MASKRKSPDHELAERSVRFLGKSLKINQFMLKATIQKRCEMQRKEDRLRQTIEHLKLRIQSELDANPSLFRELRGGDEIEM